MSGDTDTLGIIKGCCTGIVSDTTGLLDAWSCVQCSGSVEKSKEEMNSRLVENESGKIRKKQASRGDGTISLA